MVECKCNFSKSKELKGLLFWFQSSDFEGGFMELFSFCEDIFEVKKTVYLSLAAHYNYHLFTVCDICHNVCL